MQSKAWQHGVQLSLRVAEHQPLLVILTAVCILAFVATYTTPVVHRLLPNHTFETKAALRAFFALFGAELCIMIAFWYTDTYITPVGAQFYPFTFLLLAITLVAGYWAGFVATILSIPLIVLTLIYPRYHWFPLMGSQMMGSVLLELLIGYVIGCIIRRYQETLVNRLLLLRQELHFNALEKIALQSEEKALLRAIDTSSAVVTSSEISLTSILSTSQYWLSNVLKIVAEETRHLLGARYAGIGLLRGDTTELVTLAEDAKGGQKQENVASLLLEHVLAAEMPKLKVTKVISVANHPVLAGLPADQLGFDMLLISPIISKKTVIGCLFVTNKQTQSHGKHAIQQFNEFDKRRVQLFASYAGLSIINMHHYEKLSGLVEGRDQLLSMVSHELKTPLATIKLYAQLMEEQASRDHTGNGIDFTKGLETIDQEVDKLTMLVNSIHDFSRIRRGIFEIDRQDFNIAKVCQNRVEIAKTLYPDHLFTMKMVGQPGQLSGDRMRLEQVISNLLTNAAKYSDPNTPIAVTLKRQPTGYEITVKDHGKGIAAPDLHQIFEPFYQAQHSGHQAGKGLGLGLYIAKEIVERHGGKIWATSLLAKGTTFHIRLPLKPTKPQPASIAVSANPTQRRPVGVGRRLRGFALNRPR